MNRPVLAFAATALALIASPIWADEVTDTLQSAISAYEEGDLTYALEEMAYAKQLIDTKKADALQGFLPPAPDGWTREMDTEMSAGMAMFGGGIGASAEYMSPDGDEQITLTIMAGNQMVMAFGGMMGNAAAMGAKIERVGREKFMLKDGELTSVIDNKVMVQASGGEPAQMIGLLEQIDFRALGDVSG